MKYCLCLAENLANKPNNNKNDNNKAKSSKPFDPFAGPFKTGSHICDLGLHNEYRLILNKFPVLPSHILIISSKWLQQTDVLTNTEFDITWNIFQSLLLNKQNENPLIFVNSGKLSGATQMHRHLHLIPNCGQTLLLNDIAKTLSMNGNEEKQQEKVNGKVLTYDGYSFLHGIILLDDKLDGDTLAKYYETLLEWIKHKMNEDETIDNDYVSNDKFSYNLLISQKIMMIVARKCGAFEGELDKDKKVRFAINALPFAGLIFCNSDDQIKLFNKVGITAMIKQCTFASDI